MKDPITFTLKLGWNTFFGFCAGWGFVDILQRALN